MHGNINIGHHKLCISTFTAVFMQHVSVLRYCCVYLILYDTL